MTPSNPSAEGRAAHPPRRSATTNDAPPFKPRIAHYFLFALIASVINAIGSAWNGAAGDLERQPAFFRLYLGFMSLLFGAAFTAAAIVFGRWWRYGRSDFRHPGHWSLAFFAFGGASFGASELAIAVLQPYGGAPSAAYFDWTLQQLLLCLTQGLVCLLFAWRMHGNAWWKSLFALAGTAMIVLASQHVLVLNGANGSWVADAHLHASLGVATAAFPLTALACLSDHRQRLQRDWLHWAGVLALALAAIAEGSMALYVLGGF